MSFHMTLSFPANYAHCLKTININLRKKTSDSSLHLQFGTRPYNLYPMVALAFDMSVPPQSPPIIMQLPPRLFVCRFVPVTYVNENLITFSSEEKKKKEEDKKKKEEEKQRMDEDKVRGGFRPN